MRRTASVAAVVVAIAAMTAVSVSLAKSSKTKKFTCTVTLTLQSEPGKTGPDPTASSGHQFGNVSCPNPPGKGVQADSFTRTGTLTAGTVNGKFKQYYDAGTVHGTFKSNYTVTGATISFTGSSKLVGGTGAYKHSKGSAKITCTSADGGIHATCTSKVTLTHI